MLRAYQDKMFLLLLFYVATVTGHDCFQTVVEFCMSYFHSVHLQMQLMTNIVSSVVSVYIHMLLSKAILASASKSSTVSVFPIYHNV